MNDEAVYRTAPDTPGLLKIIYWYMYTGLERILNVLNMVRPKIQLAKMTKQFSKKRANQLKFSWWF